MYGILTREFIRENTGKKNLTVTVNKNMAATVKSLHEVIISGEPPVKMVNYETELITAKFIPELKDQAEEVAKKGDLMAEVMFAFYNLVCKYLFVFYIFNQKYC